MLPPPRYESDVGGVPVNQLVFEPSDARRMSAWWSKHRVSLLGRAMGDKDDTQAALKRGKKMTFNATNDRKADLRLVVVVVAATLTPNRVAECMSRPPTPAVSSQQASHWRCLEGATLVKLGQHHVRIYLSFVFAKELTKLLSNLNSCLKDHFNGVELPMRVARSDDAGKGWPRGLRCGLADVLRSARVAQRHGGGGSVLLHGSQQLRPYAVHWPCRLPPELARRRRIRPGLRGEAGGVAQEAGVQAGPLRHGVLGVRGAAGPGDAEGTAGCQGEGIEQERRQQQC